MNTLALNKKGGKLAMLSINARLLQLTLERGDLRDSLMVVRQLHRDIKRLVTADTEIMACVDCGGKGGHFINGDDFETCADCGGTGCDADDVLKVGIMTGAIQPPQQEEPAA